MCFILLLFFTCLVGFFFTDAQTCPQNDSKCFSEGQSCDPSRPYEDLTDVESVDLRLGLLHDLVESNKDLNIRGASSLADLQLARVHSRQSSGGGDASAGNIELMEVSRTDGISLRNLITTREDAISVGDSVGASFVDRLQRSFQRSHESLTTIGHAPPEETEQRVNVFNGFCRTMTRCLTGIGNGLIWALNFGRVDEDRAVARQQAFIGLFKITVGTVITGALAFAVWISASKHHQGRRQTEKAVLFTNFRIEIRGSLPEDIPYQEQPNVRAWGEVPDSVKTLMKDPPSGPSDKRSNAADLNPSTDTSITSEFHDRSSASQSKRLPKVRLNQRRDMQEDTSCNPKKASDLEGLIAPFWENVALPRVKNNGVSELQVHFFHPGLGGPQDITNGGAMTVHMKFTRDQPDVDWMRAPADNTLSSKPNWSYRPPSTTRFNHQQCNEMYLPTGSDLQDPGPSVPIWNAAADACKDVAGDLRNKHPILRPGSARLPEFAYAGTGTGDHNTGHDGTGWRIQYTPAFDYAELCPLTVTCRELFGVGGDGRTGAGFDLAEACRRITGDGRFHGGITEVTRPTWSGPFGGKGSREVVCGWLTIEPLAKE